MQLPPFENKFQSPCRHIAVYFSILNIYRYLVLVVPGMKMWRQVVVEIHQDNYPIKSADLWHCENNLGLNIILSIKINFTIPLCTPQIYELSRVLPMNFLEDPSHFSFFYDYFLFLMFGIFFNHYLQKVKFPQPFVVLFRLTNETAKSGWIS